MNCLQTYFPATNLSELCSGLFSDELDKMGYRGQVSTNWLHNKPDAIFFGRARTILLETMKTDDERIRVGLGFLGDLKSDEILVVAGSPAYAYFGELMTRLSIRQGIQGVAIDGLTRDTPFTKDAPLPIFARGYSPVDIKGRGRVATTDTTVTIQGVTVSPGDLLFADSDGLVTIPESLMLELSRRILAAIEKEKLAKRLIDEGASIERILDSVNEF